MTPPKRQSPSSPEQADGVPTSVAQVPPAIGYGHPEFQFVQSIMEMQKSLGEINASIQQLRTVIEGTRSKVDDLVNWKQRIVGGAVVLGLLLSFVGFLIGKDYVSINPPQQAGSANRTGVQAPSTPAPVAPAQQPPKGP
ncbi:MAG: hypothetical protein U1F41_05770 [Burkholderiales bacterium]